MLVPLLDAAAQDRGAVVADVLARPSRDPRVVASYRLTSARRSSAAAVNAVFGLLVAWVLVRYRLPRPAARRRAVDLPFALPTAVAGITLTALYAPNGWLGAPLAPLGIKVAFTRSASRSR